MTMTLVVLPRPGRVEALFRGETISVSGFPVINRVFSALTEGKVQTGLNKRGPIMERAWLAPCSPEKWAAFKVAAAAAAAAEAAEKAKEADKVKRRAQKPAEMDALKGLFATAELAASFCNRYTLYPQEVIERVAQDEDWAKLARSWTGPGQTGYGDPDGNPFWG